MNGCPGSRGSAARRCNHTPGRNSVLRAAKTTCMPTRQNSSVHRQSRLETRTSSLTRRRSAAHTIQTLYPRGPCSRRYCYSDPTPTLSSPRQHDSLLPALIRTPPAAHTSPVFHEPFFLFLIGSAGGGAVSRAALCRNRAELTSAAMQVSFNRFEREMPYASAGTRGISCKRNYTNVQLPSCQS